MESKIAEWFPKISADKVQKLLQYKSEIEKFSGAINLLSHSALKQIEKDHIADCILAVELIYKSAKIDEIYDIGSGNGFPGIVFAILYPQVKVKLIESDLRKSQFLKQASFSLGLKNCEVLNLRAEGLPKGTIRYGISRGFAPLTKAMLSLRGIFKVGGQYFHLKGEEWAIEVAAIPFQLCSVWEPEPIGSYKLPGGATNMSVVVTRKIAE